MESRYDLEGIGIRRRVFWASRSVDGRRNASSSGPADSFGCEARRNCCPTSCLLWQRSGVCGGVRHLRTEPEGRGSNDSRPHPGVSGGGLGSEAVMTRMAAEAKVVE
jgi:hypothetical protein